MVIIAICRAKRRGACSGLAVAATLLCVSSPAVAASGAKSDSKEAAQTGQQLSQLVETGRAVATEVARLREETAALRKTVGELQADVRQLEEAGRAAHEHNKEMREEVRGLYVENSSLKGDVAQAGEQVESLQHDLANFRLSSGIIAAMIIVLQLVVAGLVVRGSA